MSDGTVGDRMYGHDASTFTMSDGVGRYLSAWESSSVTMSGGTLLNNLYSQQSSTITMNGGTVTGTYMCLLDVFRGPPVPSRSRPRRPVGTWERLSPPHVLVNSNPSPERGPT
jgi:hypothetical protein